MKPEARKKFLEEEMQFDNEFRAQLLKDIPYFHQLYAKYNDPKWLEIVKNLDTVLKNLKKRTYV